MSYDYGHFFTLLRRCGHFAAVLLTQVLLLFKGAKDSLYAIVYKFYHKGDPLLPSFNGQLILSAVF